MVTVRKSNTSAKPFKISADKKKKKIAEVKFRFSSTKEIEQKKKKKKLLRIAGFLCSKKESGKPVDICFPARSQRRADILSRIFLSSKADVAAIPTSPGQARVYPHPGLVSQLVAMTMYRYTLAPKTSRIFSYFRASMAAIF